jgi:ABC-2 type transport system ATP-binding protein
MSEIVVEALQRSFGDKLAVAGVDLAVAEGDIYGFLGPNGAGKSTTVRMLCTLLAPTSGRAVVAGFDVATQPDQVRLRIGVALQEASLDPKQTGRELLHLHARLYGLSKADIVRRMRDLESLVDIGPDLDRRIGGYSGGMRRRLDLAASLLHEPRILFLDEPTTGLDPVSRAKVWEEVRRLNTELGVTIFLTTQYLEEADVLADRVGIISDGRIVAEGTPTELKRKVGTDVIMATVAGETGQVAATLRALRGVSNVEQHGDEFTISVADGPSQLSPVAVALAQTGAQVAALTLRTPTLDDVFLDVTGNRMASSA